MWCIGASYSPSDDIEQRSHHMFGPTPTKSAEPLPAPAGATPSASANRLAIVLFSGTVDKLMSASILATGAAAMGMNVEIFLTNWGALAFRKGDYLTNTRVSADYADKRSML